jgi:hypothetical protein
VRLVAVMTRVWSRRSCASSIDVGGG